MLIQGKYPERPYFAKACPYSNTLFSTNTKLIYFITVCFHATNLTYLIHHHLKDLLHNFNFLMSINFTYVMECKLLC